MLAVKRNLIIAILLVATLSSGLTAARESTPQTEQNRQIIADAFAAWTAGGSTFFQDAISPEVVWTIAGSGPTSGIYRTREDFLKRAVMPFTARLATPIRPTVKTIWAEGDDVIVRWDGTATAVDGKPYNNSYLWILRVEGGRAAEVTAFLDLAPYEDVIRRIPLPQ